MQNRNRFMGVDLVTLGYIFGGIEIFFYSIIVLICAILLINTTNQNDTTITNQKTRNDFENFWKILRGFITLFLVLVLICLTFPIMFVVGISKKIKCLLFPYLVLLALAIFSGTLGVFYGFYGLIVAGSLQVFGAYLVYVLTYVYHIIQFVCVIKLKDSEHFQRRHAMPFFVPQHENPALIDNGDPIAVSYPPHYKF